MYPYYILHKITAKNKLRKNILYNIFLIIKRKIKKGKELEIYFKTLLLIISTLLSGYIFLAL